MKHSFVLALICLLGVTGCQSGWKKSPIMMANASLPIGAANKALDDAPICCDQYSDIAYQALPIEETKVVEFNSASQSYQFDSGKSFVTAFIIPESNRPIDIEISSIAAEDRVFSPTVTLLDSNFQEVRKADKEFVYKSADLVNGERLEATISSVGGFKDEKYLLIYTTDQQRMNTTTMIHPAKQFALATNRVPPEIDDPVAQHSAMGLISIYAKYVGKATPSANTTVKVPESANISVEEQTNELIKQAVTDGNIEEAMRLVDDAEANGSKTARTVFIDAVKNQK
ncbi:hypothetical protein BTA51_02715 [Hahella sp. CCB-MM4]|uniref:MalM family protein n=1 Tax=Hahella sp. (strain CCB-MM4) TaxID=1926491 RepID=UPI000BD1AD7C|nr:MalM family protein [Hahella sp. CCB-MM4]OZG75314.1 hypothetical protein BTA51_02715 [Hahella sp. CCB-MM4]